MKKFITSVLLFLSPVILTGILMEVLLRKIPNDYQYKRSYLDKHSNNVDALILGSSHAYYGVNPEYMKYKSFNAAYIAQSLDYDRQIIKKYDASWHSLKFIILPVDYFSLYGKLENSMEAWRIKDYNIYYGMKVSNDIVSNSELLSNKLRINIGRIKSTYYNHELNMFCSPLGWGTNYSSKGKQNLLITGEVAAKRHSYTDKSHFNENLQDLEAIIKFAVKRNIKVLLYTSPAYKSYVKNLDRYQLNTTVNTLEALSQKYQGVFYFNLLTCQSFNENDFYDADHLDEIGAKKLTYKIDSLLAAIEKPGFEKPGTYKLAGINNKTFVNK